MARYSVQNTSGARFAVPPPVDAILPAGATVTVDVASIDTDQIGALIDSGKIAVTSLGPDSASAAAVESAPASAASHPTTRIGTVAAPIVLAAGATMTLTHALGAKAAAIDVYNMATGANFTGAADLTITQASNQVLAVQSTAGGSFVIQISFDQGVASLGANLPITDSKVAVA